MRPAFPLHTPRSAPSRGARAALREVLRQRGHVPHLHATLAASEPALRAYMAMGDALSRSTLTAQERQVVMLQANAHHQASYCMAGHSAIAEAMGMPAPWLRALREGDPLPDVRAEALRRFAQAVLAGRGEAGDAAWSDFLAAGYEAEQALDVLLALALKTLSNFTSRMTDLPLDTGHHPWAWQPVAEPLGALDE